MTAFPPDLTALSELTSLSFELPDPEDEQLPDTVFQQQIDMAWQVCDRFDLQTEIWRGRILRSVRDREKKQGDGRGLGFLKWLQDHEISKSRAYSLIELGNRADDLLAQGYVLPETVNQFSKRAFIETAQAAPEVQQLVGEAARQGQTITRREVKQLADEWTAMTSELLPEPIREKAATQAIPPRYVAPFVRELERLPESHQVALQAEVAENPDTDNLKQATATARYLARYLEVATQVQALGDENLNLELALEEALRLDCLNTTADLVSQAAQLEQAIAKFHTGWKRLNQLSERLYLDSGSSTPHLRALLDHLSTLTGDIVEVHLGGLERRIRLQVLE
jgi:hypothetical protein